MLPRAIIPALLLAALLPATAAATAPDPTGELIVRFTADADRADRAEARRAVDATLDRTLPVPGTQLLDLAPGASTAQAVERLERDDDVLYAEPNRRRTISVATNDPDAGQLWGLDSISAPAAWQLSTGSASAPVAVIDTGVAGEHPDLQQRMWTNAGEIPGNGLDDDANTFVDDVGGWDFVQGDAAPQDAHGHGTHVAGTVAAQAGNGIGVAGVAPTTSIMALRVLDADGSGRVSNLIRAYDYAARKGARVVNLSLGGAGFTSAERDAIAAAPNVLFVAAAGNNAADNDAQGVYPCTYELPNVVCVAASRRDDGLAGFSNYGARSVDLAAPGVDIYSTTRHPGSGAHGYGYLDGTSMATPHAAGAAALLLATAPQPPVAQVRRALLESTDPVADLAGRTVTGGRLNARRALDLLAAGFAAPPEAPPAPAAPAAPAAVIAPAPQSTPPPPTLVASPRQRLATVRRQGLRARVACAPACVADGTARLAAATTRRLGLPTRAVGSARRVLASAATATLTVPLTARAQQRLSTRRALSVTLSVRFTDRAGKARTLRATVRLT